MNKAKVNIDDYYITDFKIYCLWEILFSFSQIDSYKSATKIKAFVALFLENCAMEGITNS